MDGSRDTQVLTLKAEENTSDDKQEKSQASQEQHRVMLMDTIKELESTNIAIGSEIGDTCPVCREGHVEDIGGCNTCTSCGAQLKCGL